MNCINANAKKRIEEADGYETHTAIILRLNFTLPLHIVTILKYNRDIISACFNPT